MPPNRRRLIHLEDDSESDNNTGHQNHTAEEKRQVRNKIQDIHARIEHYRTKGDIKKLWNDEEFKKTMDEAKELTENIADPQEYLDDAKMFTALVRLVHEMSVGIDGNLHKFSNQDFAMRLADDMGLAQLDGGLFRMKRHPLANFGKRMHPLFPYAPTYQFLLGAMPSEAVEGGATPKRLKKRPVAQRARDTGATKIATIGKNQTAEALTDKYVKQTLKCLQKCYEENDRKPLCYFTFVIDPDSFGKTVEAMFHVSFLIRQRTATLSIGKQGLPVLYPNKKEDMDSDSSDEEGGGGDSGSIDQAVINMNICDWENIKDCLGITEKMIHLD